MGRAKEIIVKVIPAKIANEFVKQNHYSGKVTQTSSLHFGCFLDNKLHGVLSYGSPLDKRKVLGLVNPSLWNEMLELNRMAFDEYLPKNSESRCIAISIMLIKKNAPHIKWLLSFSDGCQCGDGTIYRASGFHLTAVKKNDRLIKFDGNPEERFKKMVDAYKAQFKAMHPLYFQQGTRPNEMQKAFIQAYLKNGAGEKEFVKRIGASYFEGFQLRYIYLIDKTCKITVPILPFSKIDEMGAGMYKGKKITLAERQNAPEVLQAAQQVSSLQEGFDSTPALNITEKKQ